MRGSFYLLMFFLLGFLSGCFGRISDNSGGFRINAKEYGLDPSKPALLVFGATWCKPCLSEISHLNMAHAELGKKVQIVGFIVEGPQKGVAAAPKDTELFKSAEGEPPSYKVSLDASWNLFDGVSSGLGHILPTLVFVDSSQMIVRVVQRSMDYRRELLPMLRTLSGEGSSKPAPLPEEPSGKPVNLTFAEWSAISGNEPGSAIYENVSGAWRRGLADFSFPAGDMPFESARMTNLLFEDGRMQIFSALWVAEDTGCRLTVFFNADGSYERSEGVCR